MPDPSLSGCPAQPKPVSWADRQTTVAHTLLSTREQRQGLGGPCWTVIQNSTASKQGLRCKLFPKVAVFLRAVDELGWMFFNLTFPGHHKSGLSKMSPYSAVTLSPGAGSPHLQPVISKALRMHLYQSTWYPLLSPSHTVSTPARQTPASVGLVHAQMCLPPLLCPRQHFQAQGLPVKGSGPRRLGRGSCQSSGALPTSPAPEPALPPPCPLPSAPNNKALSPSMPCPSQSLQGGQGGQTPPCWSLTGVLMRSRFPPSCGLGPVKAVFLSLALTLFFQVSPHILGLR